MTTAAFLHVCVGYPDGECHCFHPLAEVMGRPIPDHDCPEPFRPAGELLVPVSPPTELSPSTNDENGDDLDAPTTTWHRWETP